MTAALEVIGLEKAFGKLEVLRGLDLTVDEHEVVCLIGASGSGKSTLLRCINLIEPIDAGRIVIEGVPNDEFFWALIALTLIYSAYVSEVYRAGIESVHPSQNAAARSLGLSQVQSLRHVVLPQAVRRVVPPLLNDFIGLQKDSVLVSFIGVVEIFRTAQIKQAATFNFSYYIGVALVFIVVTIPLARLVDWLVARERRSRMAGAAP